VILPYVGVRITYFVIVDEMTNEEKMRVRKRISGWSIRVASCQLAKPGDR
jgi:hypothetical protein